MAWTKSSELELDENFFNHNLCVCTGDLAESKLIGFFSLLSSLLGFLEDNEENLEVTRKLQVENPFELT